MLGVHENLMLHCSAQCQQDFRHECLRSALPTMPTGRDPTTRRSRRSKKPRKTRGARRSAPPENNLAHARPKGPLRSPRSTMSSHRSGETFGRHARAIAKRGSLVARCSSLTSCRGVVLYAFGLHFADVHRSCFGLHFAVLRSTGAPPPLRDRCKMLDAINDAARSTTPVSTASFVSRFRALRLRLALRRCPPLARASC